MEAELLERVEKWAKEAPTKTMLSFADDKGAVSASLTCGELNRKMQNLAAILRATPAQHPKGLGLQQGATVLLVYPPGLDFIVAFLACLRAGVVAVPVYPPDPRKMKKDISMFMAVAQSSRAQVALTCGLYMHAKKISAIKQKFSLSSQQSWPEHLKWITTDDLVDAKGADSATLGYPRADDVAFLQYTSGSTSAPKGVVLTHGNLTHNLRTISSALHAGRDTVVVSWLPQYHDMGLIGAYLGTIFNGGTGVYLSPFSFIKNPCLWIQLISKYRATHLQAPNFAYALLARKADKLHADSSIDLSCVRHMINGAEPIQGEAMDGFYRAFSPFGLPAGVVKPTYGLAEHTVYVCGSGSQRVWVDKPALERDGVFTVMSTSNKPGSTAELKEMIGCGVPSKKDHGIDLRVVNPDTNEERKEGETGEIWISSASKAHGYYGDELRALSIEAFQAKVASSDDSTTFLRTGDIGVLYNGELFICGRMKDLVIIRGRNHYPQDIEATAEGHEELRPGCCAAFAFSRGGGGDSDDEQLAVVAELRDPDISNKASLCGKIRAAIAREHGVRATLIVLLSPRSIPKTTSGKISRSRCKQALESKQLSELYRNEDMIGGGDLEVDGDDVDDVAAVQDEVMDRGGKNSAPNGAGAPGGEGTQKLPAIITGESPERVYAVLLGELAQLLGVDKRDIDVNTPLQELGMDSMALTQLQGIVAQKFKVHVDEEVLYGESTTFVSLHAALCGLSASQVHGSVNGSAKAGSKKAKLVCGCIAC